MMKTSPTRCLFITKIVTKMEVLPAWLKGEWTQKGTSENSMYNESVEYNGGDKWEQGNVGLSWNFMLPYPYLYPYAPP